MNRVTTFIILLLMPCFYTLAQPLSIQDIVIEDESFSHVYHIDLTASKIHGKVNQWVARSFNDYHSVVQYDDKENYRLITKSITDFDEVGLIAMSFALTIDCKDGRYRVLADALNFKVTTEEGLYSYDDFITTDERILFKEFYSDYSSIELLYNSELEKWGKAQNRWKPKQLHYSKAKEEFEKVEGPYLLAHSTKETIEKIMPLRDALIRKHISELFNSISEFIARDDDF